MSYESANNESDDTDTASASLSPTSPWFGYFEVTLLM